MSGFSPKRLLRRFVLATSFPPFLQLYRILYQAAAALAVRMFRHYGAVRSIYMRRGGARGDILPLVSDIDFAVITGPMSDADRADLYDEYESLVRRTTVLDKSLELYSEEEFFRDFERDDYARFRFTEGKRTWRLVYGRDYVKELPDLSPDELASGLFTEIKVWWALFGWRFFQARKYNDETVTRNNVCFKTVGEVLRMDLALRGKGLAQSRLEAFEKAVPLLNDSARSFVRLVEGIPKTRYRLRRESLVEETMGFLLGHLDSGCDRFTSHPLASPLGSGEQVIEYDRSESHRGQREDSLIDRVAGHVRSNWACGIRNVRVTPGAYFNVDELVLFIEPAFDTRPTVGEVTGLNLALREVPSLLRERIRIFLLLPHAAFQLDPQDLMKSWQTILVPYCNPDVFELMGRKDSLVTGEMTALRQGPARTPLVEHFFRAEKTLFYELLDHPSVYKLCGLDFCRIFWKAAQLVVLNRSAARGSVLYPMTPPAISRALSAEGVAIPGPLLDLDPIYREELRGVERDVGEFIPAAVDYLREIR